MLYQLSYTPRGTVELRLSPSIRRGRELSTAATKLAFSSEPHPEGGAAGHAPERAAKTSSAPIRVDDVRYHQAMILATTPAPPPFAVGRGRLGAEIIVRR